MSAIQMPPGDYVLGTKFSDGSARDPWYVGFLERRDGKHVICNERGITISHHNLMRIQPITGAIGRMLLDKSDILEMGGVNLWELVAELSEVV